MSRSPLSRTYALALHQRPHRNATSPTILRAIPLAGIQHAPSPQTCLRKTTRGQSRQRHPVHRAPYPRRQGPVRAERRKHGFAAATFAVARLEDLDEVAHLKTDLVAVYQPINAQEFFAVERIALAQQSLLRAARLEAGLFQKIHCLSWKRRT